ncbi:hypothetical protein [Brevibacillus dissolubilis]|uniref:hypothetical protein n=1 Tax=Brevibacillus dissolubilis TaxID=1844116 RepID=UPI001115BEE2|nr:hypothetical protein [Brevibacillus dissolubilis]
MDLQTIAEMEGTVAEKCMELAEILELTEPVSEEVLYAAIYDSNYARNLLNCRKQPVFLQHLLANPPAVPAEKKVEKLDASSQVALVQKMGEALWNWGKVGFTRVDDETNQKRLAACMSCPNLSDPPEALIYKMAAVAASNKQICTECGCLISRKTRLPSESCPSPHPTEPDVTRWGDPIH